MKRGLSSSGGAAWGDKAVKTVLLCWCECVGVMSRGREGTGGEVATPWNRRQLLQGWLPLSHEDHRTARVLLAFGVPNVEVVPLSHGRRGAVNILHKLCLSSVETSCGCSLPGEL